MLSRNMQLFLIASPLLVGIGGPASAAPMLYAWGNDLQTLAIDPIGATVTPVKGAGEGGLGGSGTGGTSGGTGGTSGVTGGGGTGSDGGSTTGTGGLGGGGGGFTSSAFGATDPTSNDLLASLEPEDPASTGGDPILQSPKLPDNPGDPSGPGGPEGPNTSAFAPPDSGGSPLSPAVTIAAVPEPGSLALLGIALASLGMRLRRRKS